MCQDGEWLMLKRGFLILLSGFALLGNAPNDNIPQALAPYVVNGKLKTDDFGWMRGAFDGASEQQKADWAGIQRWSDECVANAKAKAVAELKLLGIENVNFEGVPMGAPLCSSVIAFNGMALPTRNWEQFVANEAKARQAFLLYKHGARIAAQNMPYETAWGNEDAWNLLAATIEDQVFRMAFNWGANEKAPKLDPASIPYFRAHVSNAVGHADDENTEFLKKLVSEKGWPTISRVGQQAAGKAWLLVQHADHDPAFQLRALRLMEPLVATGEVSKGNYAYLYDRIMLKLSGKQRFGTQFMGCDGEEHKLRPLEDEKQLDKLRAEYQLEPITEYRKGMKEAFGPCRAN
jgi:hypothetical protein